MMSDYDVQPSFYELYITLMVQ